jgi:hypothetical protein
MFEMIRVAALVLLFSSISLKAFDEKRSSNPSYGYDVARAHEITPHRRRIPIEGVPSGFNQLHLFLIVSPTGDVLDAKAVGDDETLKFWPQLRGEVSQWKFKPFEKNGGAIQAEVEEYIDLVPAERLPQNHVAAPVLRPDSKVTITLERSGCYGTCPSYTVSLSTGGVVFEGREYVAAHGRHTRVADADDVRKLAKKFVDADFYSMDASYTASVTDNPAHILTITIDGYSKKVDDYVGSWVGMPAVITELENDVDSLAHTDRWIGHTKRRR